MTEKQAKLLNTILFSSIFGSLFILLRDNPNDHNLIIALVFIYGAIQFFRYSLFKIPLHKPHVILLIGAQLFIAAWLQAIDGTFLPQLFLFILIAEIAYRSEKKISVPFTMISYISYILAVAYHFGFPPFHEISYVIPRAIEYILFWGFSYIARHATLQKEELASAHVKLQHAAKELEEKTMLQERMKLSKEIHDAVGHTLTTALFGIESSKHMINQGDVKKGVGQLEKSTIQIRRSLEDVRSIVHTMKEKETVIDLKGSLLQLIKETEERSGVVITYEIEEHLQSLTPEQELAIYRSLQEGITNGIRHGNSSTFFYQIINQDGELHILLEDQGSFDGNCSYGFGLQAMENRFKLLGGTISISTNTFGGCTLRVVLPIRDQKRSEGGNRYVEPIESSYS
ncbi:sensor histidine kinase [Evansella tamaricis]|uniref:histidine kinase n=1 Tax=Evansella tamaricis TaxID=2069301 RepID=A0ABS6JG11_9BACI|nr:histidine kinase [Evansella tamaricis]MBU9712566.1 hypothetical protein [Evansella tamaricis]